MLEKNVPFMFNPRDTAKILSISRSQVYQLLKTGDLESVRIGRSRRISQDQLIRYINKLES
jgi:excisionase family DNA binding protein